MNESKANVGSGTGWMMVWGIVMLICGIAAIALPWASGIGVVIVVGWVLIFAAVSHLLLAFHTHTVGGVLWQILLFLIYGAAGVFMLMNPLAGLVTLTLVLAVFLLIEAALEPWRFWSGRNGQAAPFGSLECSSASA
jgi:uncharacterized membrane protein HdeD (DUF308 family)